MAVAELSARKMNQSRIWSPEATAWIAQIHNLTRNGAKKDSQFMFFKHHKDTINMGMLLHFLRKICKDYVRHMGSICGPGTATILASSALRPTTSGGSRIRFWTPKNLSSTEALKGAVLISLSHRFLIIIARPYYAWERGAGGEHLLCQEGRRRRRNAVGRLC